MKIKFFRLPAYVPPPGVRPKHLGKIAHKNQLWAGDGYLAGEAQLGPNDPLPDGLARRNNVPSSLLIVVYDQISKLPVAQTRSNNDGTWTISGLRRVNSDGSPCLYFAIAFDNVDEYNAGIQDRQQPAIMP
jgi:hypothetical protein